MVNGGQASQEREEKTPEAAENVPAGQGTQTVLFLAAGVVEYVPGVHRPSQKRAPASGLKLPAAHGVQLAFTPEAVISPKYPGAHRLQAVELEREATPRAQGVHT